MSIEFYQSDTITENWLENCEKLSHKIMNNNNNKQS